MWKKKKKRTPQDKGRQPSYMYRWHPSWLCNMRPPNQTSCLWDKEVEKMYKKNYATWPSGLSSLGMNPIEPVPAWIKFLPEKKNLGVTLCVRILLHYDFCCFKFVMVCFRAQNGACLGVFSTWAWDMCILLLLNEVICRCYIHLVYGVVEFSYVLTDFLPAGPVHLRWMDVEISSYNSRFISFHPKKEMFVLISLSMVHFVCFDSFSMVYFSPSIYF